MNIRDSSSPSAPQNDSAYGLFRSLFSPAQPQNADPALRGRRYAKLSHYRDATSPCLRVERQPSLISSRLNPFYFQQHSRF